MLASVSGKEAKTLKDPQVLMCSIVVVIFNTIMTLTNRAIGSKYNYKRGSMITFAIFIGEYLTLIYLAIPMVISKKFRNDHFAKLKSELQTESKQLVEVNQLWLALPALLDVINTTLKNLALLLLPASIQQMLLGGTIITACLVSKLMLKREMQVYHWIGNVLAIAGFSLAGYSSVLSDDEIGQSNTWNNVLGVVLIVIELFISAIQTNIEEWIFHQHSIHVARGTGLEGLFGMIWSFSFMVAFSFVRCPRSSMCDIAGFFDDPSIGLKEAFADPVVCALMFTMIISASVYNVSIVTLIKRVSCIYPFFCAAMSTLLIWVLSVQLGLEGFSWQGFAFQSSGFAFLLAGNLCYNGHFNCIITPKKKEAKSN